MCPRGPSRGDGEGGAEGGGFLLDAAGVYLGLGEASAGGWGRRSWGTSSQGGP